MIELDYNKILDVIHIKAIQTSDMFSEDFITDRDNLNLFKDKKAKYDESDYFLHWELPSRYIGNIIDRFQDILYTSAGDELLAKYKKKLRPVQEFIDKEIYGFQSVDGKILTSYQREYCNTLSDKNAILCSFDQGLGKTRAGLTGAKEQGYKRLLIIAPKNTLSNWASEILDIYGCCINSSYNNYLTYKGPVQRRKELRTKLVKPGSLPPYVEYDLVLTNYEMVGELKTLKFDSVIIDEIQNLSNPTIKIYKDCEQLLRNSQPKLIQGLSGTPIRLKVRDLWAVWNLLDPMIAGGQIEFIEDYEQVLSSARYQFKHNGLIYTNRSKGRRGAKNIDKLKQKQESIIFRVKRDNFVSFKESVDIVNVEMTKKQKEFYNEILEKVSLEVDIKNVLHQTLQLVKAAEGLHNFKESQESGKLDYIKEEIKKGDKTVIWTRFKATTFLLKSLYPDKVVVYNSKIPDGLRKLNVWAFQGVKDNEREEFERLCKYHPEFNFVPGEAQLFVGTVNLRSGLGINLHSASRSIFMSFDTNPNANIQAKDRIARLGQLSDEIYTRFLVSMDTKERKILELLLTYYEIYLKILDGECSKDFQLARKILNEIRGI